jgi:hypothetical protein
MKVTTQGNNYILRIDDPKDLRLLKAFLHLDHFINTYEDDSLEAVINMVATDEVELDRHMDELQGEIANDSTFDEGLIPDAN